MVGGAGLFGAPVLECRPEAVRHGVPAEVGIGPARGAQRLAGPLKRLIAAATASVLTN